MIIILFSVFGCDHVSKKIAKNYLSESPPISYLEDFVVLNFVENKGAFLGFGSGLPDHIRYWIFRVMSGVFLFGFLVYISVHNDFTYFEIIVFSTIIGGGIGNLYDRVFRSGYVGDFMNIGIGPVRTGVFNLADVAIMFGLGMLLYLFFKRFMKHRKIMRTSND
jgi:signal peptidase II